MKSIHFLAAAALVAAFPAQAAKDLKDTRDGRYLLGLTPADVARMVVVKDDDLDTVATLSTIDVYKEKHGLLGFVPYDVFLRAFVSKKTGQTEYQVYAAIQYAQQHWEDWSQVNYETPKGIQDKPLITLARQFGGCYKYSGCQRAEAVAFYVDEAMLREMAARYQPGEAAAWQFKLQGRLGAERRDGFVPAEIAGLLMAVDQYKAAHNLR